MQVAVDISLYPLDENFIPPIKAFIERVNGHAGITVKTNPMSTQIRGSYDEVMDLLKSEIAVTFDELPKAVFAIKILNNPLAD